MGDEEEAQEQVEPMSKPSVYIDQDIEDEDEDMMIPPPLGLSDIEEEEEEVEEEEEEEEEENVKIEEGYKDKKETGVDEESLSFREEDNESHETECSSKEKEKASLLSTLALSKKVSPSVKDNRRNPTSVKRKENHDDDLQRTVKRRKEHD